MFRLFCFAVAAVLSIAAQSADVISAFSNLEEPLCTTVFEVPFQMFSIQVCFDTTTAEGVWNSATFKWIPHGEGDDGGHDEKVGVLYAWDIWNKELKSWQTDGWSMTDVVS